MEQQAAAGRGMSKKWSRCGSCLKNSMQTECIMMKGLIKVVSKKSKKSERKAESSSTSGSWIVAFSSRLHAVTYKSLQTWHDGQKLGLRPTSQQIEFIGFLHLQCVVSKPAT